MLQKIFALYRSRLPCLLLLLWLGACTSAVPYQAMSDAKRALASAETYLAEQKPVNAIDQQDYQQARRSLTAAEQAISEKQFGLATSLIETSKAHSQAILKRRQQQTNRVETNIKFRY